METKTTFSLFFTLHNFELSLALFGHFFNIHRVKSIQKSLNYRSNTDSIVSDRCRRARARVSIFAEFRNFFRGNFEKTEKFRNGKRRKFRYFIFFFGLHRGLRDSKIHKRFWVLGVVHTKNTRKISIYELWCTCFEEEKESENDYSYTHLRYHKLRRCSSDRIIPFFFLEC